MTASFAQRATARGQEVVRQEQTDRAALNEVWRQITNRAARILRKLGFEDDMAEGSNAADFGQNSKDA